MEVKSSGGTRVGWADSGEGSSLKRPGLEQDQGWTESPRMTPGRSSLADVMSHKTNNNKNNAVSLGHGPLRRLEAPLGPSSGLIHSLAIKPWLFPFSPLVRGDPSLGTCTTNTKLNKDGPKLSQMSFRPRLLHG